MGHGAARIPAPDAKPPKGPETAYIGLSAGEVRALLERHGFNELPKDGRRGVTEIMWRVLREPMLLLLIACGVVYLVSGELQEGILLFGSAIFVVAITLYQEVKSERALEALRDLASPPAAVIREGRIQRIPARELVPGDLLRINEGDRVPADAVLVATRHVSVDESVLTGEAFAVAKFAAPRFLEVRTEMPPADQRLYSGTLVVAGQGLAVVTATGPRTELGKIGRALEEAPQERSALQRELGRLVRIFAILGVAASIGIAVIYGLTRGDWTRGLLAGLATAMSLLPEEFPVVLAIFLALGAWRLAKKNVLTRQVAAIEVLGSISALCVDKTGTLTENRMSVRTVWGADQNRVLELAVLACSPQPFDPMEKAILAAGQAREISVPAGEQLIRQYPVSPDLMAMVCVWRRPGDDGLSVATKGAPEAVIDLCRLEPTEGERVLQRVHELAGQGLRVLGVGEARHSRPELPEHPGEFPFRFAGLLALEDPIRPDAPAAVEECRRAGIRVIMLTGDYPETARSIASRLSLLKAGGGQGSSSGLDEVVSGAELDGIDDGALAAKTSSVAVFARVRPEQKLRIISALKARGERVAMTGDGVNDAPGLKWADIGVAMGGRGTDVAREAADMVLLDDSFTSLVAGIRQGRRIYDNLKKAILFVATIHVCIAGLAILPVLLKLPLLLLPPHIVFLELVIDPACSLVYEIEEDERGLMDRPPRAGGVPLLSRPDFARTALQGGIVLVLVLGLYFGLLQAGYAEGRARAVAFISVVLSNLALILVNRSREARLREVLKHSNKAFNWIVSAALLTLIAVLSIPAARRLFSFEPVQLADAGLALLAGVLSLLFCSAARFWTARA